MIYDNIELLPQYDPRFTKAVAFLQNCTPDMEAGRYEIDDDDMYASVQVYDTKDEAQGAIEAHLRYIDIQTCLTGREAMDFFAISDLTIKSRDEARDLVFYHSPSFKGNRVETCLGKAAVFYPQDAHRPAMHPAAGRQNIKKIVIKIKV